MIIGLYVLADYGERHETARILALIAGGTLAGLSMLLGALQLIEVQTGLIKTQQATSEVLGIALLAAGLLSLLYLVPAVQRAVARVIPSRPGSPVMYLTVVFGLTLIAQEVGSQLQDVAVTQPLTYADLLSQDIPFFLLAFAGVGIFIRRSPGQTMQRLGLTRPVAGWWWLIALGAIGAFLAVAAGIEHVANIVAPAQQKQVSNVSNVLFSRFNSPTAVVFLGLLAGIVEETLFRGALVPRLGVVITAILFAALHTQYAISFATLEVLILGLALGWIRVYSKSSLTCMVTHAGYDIVVGLLGVAIIQR